MSRMAGVKFAGAYTALATPFEKGAEAVDYEEYKKLAEFNAENGIAGFVVNGTTGESPTTTREEYVKMLETAIEAGDGKTIVAGSGGNNVAKCDDYTNDAAELGAHACLLVDCYYNGPSSLELRLEYHGYLAGKYPEMSFMPYIIPGRCGCELSVEDLAILRQEHPNVVAVKEATGDLERMKKTRRLLDEDFTIMSGDDDKTLAMMLDPAISAAGVVSVWSNVFPKSICEMVAAAAAGNAAEAKKIEESLKPIFGKVTVKTTEKVSIGGKDFEVVQKFRNPVGLKIAMEGLGMCSGEMRRPLGKLSVGGVAVLRQALREAYQKSPELYKPLEGFFEVDAQERIENDKYWTRHY